MRDEEERNLLQARSRSTDLNDIESGQGNAQSIQDEADGAAGSDKAITGPYMGRWLSILPNIWGQRQTKDENVPRKERE